MSDCDDFDDTCCGDWSVYQTAGSTKQYIETGLSEEVARQMVEDYRAEGEEVWMERTAPKSE